MGLGLTIQQIRKQPAPYGVCPVCKYPLVDENIPMGYSKADRNGKQKKEMKFGAVLPLIINKAIETTAFSFVGCKRPEYVVCHNEDCPLHYSLAHPVYQNRPIVGNIGSVRGDLGGIGAMFAKMAYKPKMPKNKKKKFF